MYCRGVRVTRIVTFVTGLFLIFESTLFALPPGQMNSDQSRPALSGIMFLSDSVFSRPIDKLNSPIRTQDIYSYIDVNNSLAFVTNLGAIGTNINNLWSSSGGMFYPYSGDTVDIVLNPDKVLLYCAGLFLGGKVGGNTRVAVATYEQEYVPGPMSGGTSMPDQSSFRVYKIDTSSGPGDYFYDNWPIAQGAPTDQYGDPLLLGQQTLWTVYNDAGTHIAAIGGTAPLGIEVRQTVWGSADTNEDYVFYVQYELYNKGANYIDSFYICFYADPDIGGPTDDLVGCDTALDMFFAFNGDNNDAAYGTTPPAWGGQVAYGPVVPSVGDTAYFAGNEMPNYKNMRMTSFSSYINGQDPNDAEDTYLYMIGWDGIGHQPYVDPFSGDSTTFKYAGDPLTATGWLDPVSDDKRLMAGFGPLTFNPGDSQQVLLKIAGFGAMPGNNHLLSLHGLKSRLAAAGNSQLRPLYIRAYSPVNLWVIDPEEYYIGKDASGAISQTIFPADYNELPPDYIDEVIIYYPIPGEYEIIVIPEDDAPPGALYSVGIRIDGSEQAIIVENADVPASGTTDEYFYVVEDGYQYINGDANRDNNVNLIDILYLISYLYDEPPGPAPYPPGAADANCDEYLNLIDILYLIAYLYDNSPGSEPCHSEDYE